MTALISSKRRVAALVAAGVIGGGLVGVAVSQLGVASAANGPSPTPFVGPMMGAPVGPMSLGGPGGRVLHGEATVAKPGGGTAVVRMQTGRITDVGGSSVTVRSSDGYVATYTIDSGTRIVLNGARGALSSLKAGDTVRAFGVVDGTAVRAKAVLDGVPTEVRRFVREWRHGMHPGFALRHAG